MVSASNRRIAAVAMMAAAACVSGCSEKPPPTLPGTVLGTPGTVLGTIPGTVLGTTPSTVQNAAALPAVDQIGAAIAAVEDQLGGPQQFFEVTATPLGVNVWVAMNNATATQRWTFRDATLTSAAPQTGASGHTFEASAVSFDAAKLLDGVRSRLPGSAISAMEIVGSATGEVRYTAIVVGSRANRALLVVVDPTGEVLSVDNA